MARSRYLWSHVVCRCRSLCKQQHTTVFQVSQCNAVLGTQFRQRAALANATCPGALESNALVVAVRRCDLRQAFHTNWNEHKSHGGAALVLDSWIINVQWQIPYCLWQISSDIAIATRTRRPSGRTNLTSHLGTMQWSLRKKSLWYVASIDIVKAVCARKYIWLCVYVAGNKFHYAFM